MGSASFACSSQANADGDQLLPGELERVRPPDVAAQLHFQLYLHGGLALALRLFLLHRQQLRGQCERGRLRLHPRRHLRRQVSPHSIIEHSFLDGFYSQMAENVRMGTLGTKVDLLTNKIPMMEKSLDATCSENKGRPR